MVQEKWDSQGNCQVLTYRTSIAELQKVRYLQDIRQAFLNGI